MYSVEGLFVFENEEYVVFYLLSGQGPASSIILLLWSFCPQGRNRSAWGPLICLRITLFVPDLGEEFRSPDFHPNYSPVIL